MSEGWQLGIDFGTSYTVAAIASPNGVAVLDIESNGQSRMPSSVFLTASGDILVGTAAQHQSVFAPERFEATPKRSLSDGDIFLGDQLVPVTDLIAAVLRRVYVEACRQRGETLPDLVSLTHPAVWGAPRLARLREAAQRAGLPEVRFIAEPVAAALWIAGAVTHPGQHVAVYDFGGGTFDAAVLLRDATGFEVAGPPVGRDPLGGEDIDQHIVDYIGTTAGADAPEQWASLLDPPDVAWRRRSAALRMEVRRAKETLSEVNTCQLWIPGLEQELQLTRPELDALIIDDVNQCTDTLMTALADSSVTAEQLAGLYLVGGSSRIPLVAETLWRRLGIRPLVHDSPKSVVALGATRPFGMPRQQQRVAEEPNERSVVTIRDAVAAPVFDRADHLGRPVVPPTLLITLPPELKNSDSRASAQVVLDRVAGEPATIRLREEETVDATAYDLAMRIGAFRAARSQGYQQHSLGPADVLGGAGVERRFTMWSGARPVQMVERYRVGGRRAIVLAFPAAVQDVADALSLTLVATPAGTYASPIVLPRIPGWQTTEQVVLRGDDNSVVVSAERQDLPAEPVEAWRWHRLENLMRTLPNAAVAGRSAGAMIGGLPGDIVTVRWTQHQTAMLTKLGTTSVGSHGLVLQLNLALAAQGEFPRLASLVILHPSVARTG